MIAKSQRWHRTGSAAAVIALLGLFCGGASALSLGRISVQSALGELLKAEIEIPNITPEEAASLKTSVASPAAFVAAGLEYNQAVASLQASLVRRADGRAYLRLSSDRPINDPFIDLILEASWSSGRIVRDYTMLFDPPALKKPAPDPTLAQITTPAASAATKAAPTNTMQVAPVAEPVHALASAASAPAKVASAEPRNSTQQLVVKPGDSASQIAARSKTSDVSLDQMLVAMLRANPNAFSSGNLNRLRSGAVLDVPTTAQAQAMSATEATQTVLAQSKDFNEFRRKLAGIAPKAAVEASNRKAMGRVQTQVEEKKPGNSAADKLTLSKGALQAKADEARLTKERAEKEAASRAAELAKNIADLSKLSMASAAAPAPTEPSSQAAQGLPTLPVAAAIPAPVAAASAPPAAAAKPAASSAAKPVEPVKKSEPGLIDQLREDPTLPMAGSGILALVAGLFWYRRRRAKAAAPVDSFLLPSPRQAEGDAEHMEPELDATQSPMGTADDVDPVAEADVYLAYGRDKQAEEMLKAALVHSPERVAIHSKLLDIYAKRRDAAGFLASANTAFELVGGASQEWARICELGLSIDPHNPLYQPGGARPSAFGSLAQDARVDPPAGGDDAAASANLPPGNSDLDLDLDFSAQEAQATVLPEQPSAHQATASDGIDFDVPELDAPETTAENSAPLEMPQELADLSLALDDFQPATTEQPTAATELSAQNAEQPEPEKPELPEAAKASDGMMEFDLSSLALDLDPHSQFGAEDATSESGDNSLETKLALAEEFVSIGDQDGARALIEEVVAEATGELHEKAQLALANLT